ncbi:MAG: hypothetical protein R3E32_27895 [Chitinophagales bacterium]
MKTNHKIALISLLSIHLFIIVLNNIGVANSFTKDLELPRYSEIILDFLKTISPEKSNIALEASSVYSIYAGTNTGYGFFSPNVPTKHYVHFELTDKDEVSSVQLPAISSQEGMTRFSSNVSLFKQNEVLQDLQARCWGLRMLELNPESKQVKVMMSAYVIPSMEAYRKGERPSLESTGLYEFELN